MGYKRIRSGRLVGLSKLEESLHTNDIAVLIEADHLCVASRGVKDTGSSTQTSYYKGKFRQAAIRREFLDAVE